MKLSDFDYELPEELIAQHPPHERTASRMMVVDRESGNCMAAQFTDLLEYLHAGDCLVFNDTRVIPARLLGRRAHTGGKVEILCLEKLEDGKWHCMMKPGRRMRPGQCIEVDSASDNILRVERRREDGTFEIGVSQGQNLDEIIKAYGNVPLPPYIQRNAGQGDIDRYQTVYARRPGAVAAPTAGLHFSPEMLDRIDAAGITRAYVTLHVGPGTFRPVKTERIEEHEMHEERFELGSEAVKLIENTRARGGRIVAVGTTSVRVLESCADESGNLTAGSGRTRLFMHPPVQPRVTDGMLTNFHLPRSTLLMLVACFCSTEKILAAYRLAVREKFRFYSYGDCMLLLPGLEF